MTTSGRQGDLRNVEVTPGLLRRGFNLWPPYLTAGIRVTHIARFHVAIVAECDKTLSIRREARSSRRA